jgi:hypothetical protein
MNKFLSPASNRPFNRFASTIIGQQPVTSLTLSDLNANAFVKTDSSKKLVSANISSADITDLPVSKRLKTNDLGSIVAEDISISEIVNLQDTLNSKVNIENGTQITIEHVRTDAVLDMFGGSAQISFNNELNAIYLIAPNKFYIDSPLFTQNGNAVLTTSNGVSKTMNADLNANSFSIANVNQINNLTPAGGKYMMLTAGNEITGTTTETSLFNGSTSLGSLEVGANTSTQSAFQLVLYGTFGAIVTHDLTIKVKMGPTTIVTLFMQDLVGVTGEHFEIECDYSITDLTSPTLASITTNLEFSYSSTGSASFVGDRIVNTTTFDSTITNEISVTVQWGSTSSTNKIRCLRGTLRRIY